MISRSSWLFLHSNYRRLTADTLLALSSIDIATPLAHLHSPTMCVDVYDQYVDCERDHTIESYHRCLKGTEYILEINNDGCVKSRVIYCTKTGTCPKCANGSDWFESSSDTAMDISDTGEDSDDDPWGTTSAPDAKSSESGDTSDPGETSDPEAT
jgi:hypothetical protein